MKKTTKNNKRALPLPRSATTATCKAIASSGHLVCVLEPAHLGAHSTAAPVKGKKPMQHATWAANAAGQVIVTTSSHGKRQSEWTEPAPITAEPVVEEIKATFGDASESIEVEAVRADDHEPEDDPRPAWLREQTEQRDAEGREQMPADTATPQAKDHPAGQCPMLFVDPNTGNPRIPHLCCELDVGHEGRCGAALLETGKVIEWGEEFDVEPPRHARNIARAKREYAAASNGKPAKDPSLAAACEKCGLEIGEHNGKKCPKAAKGTKAKSAPNLKPCIAEDAAGHACSKVHLHDGEHSNPAGWKAWPEEKRDLVRVGDAEGTGTWCVETKRGRDPRGKIKDNYVETACGDRVYVTTSDIDYLHGALLLPPRAPGSGLRSVQCPIKTARKVELAEANLCTSCAFAINPHVEDAESKEKRLIAERDARIFGPEALADQAARDALKEAAAVRHRPLTLEDEPEDDEPSETVLAMLDQEDAPSTPQPDAGKRCVVCGFNPPLLGMPNCGTAKCRKAAKSPTKKPPKPKIAGLAVCPAKWEHARACELHAGHVGAHVAHLSGSGRGLMTWETGTDDPNHWECCSVRRAGVRCDRPAEHDGSHLALHPHQGEQHLCQWNNGEPGANDVSVGSLELLYKRPIDVALALEKNFVEPEARRSPLTLEDDPEDDEPSEVAIAALDQEDEHDPFAPSATSPAATSSPTTSGEPVDDGKLIAPTGATITCGGRVYPTHPMARIFPTPEKQYRDIVASIRLHGLQKEIELLDEPGNPVIDGCSRLRACEELGITPRTKVVHVEDKLAYVKAVNLDRRHLDESRRAIAAAGLATIAHGSNQHTRGPADMPVMTQAQAAEAMGVSERMVRDVVRVNNAGASAVVEAMNSGRLKVSAAAEFLKDNLGKSKQSEIFEKVTKGNGEVRPGKVRSLVKQEMKRELISKINTGRVAPMPMGPFGVIYGDYPWLYGNSDQHEGSRGHNGYPAMPMDDIIAHAIEARKRAAEDCVLALWFTNAFLREVGRVVDAYGAVQHTAWTWDKCTEKNDKDKKGVGTWGRGRTEHLVIASIGNPVHTLNEVDTLIRAAVREHSQKPEVFAELLGKHCSGPFLEMFARDPREGWTTWGAEAEGSKATEVKPKKKSKILTATDRQMRGSAA